MNVKKLAIRTGAVLLLSAAGLAAYVILKQPQTSAPRAGSVPKTPERIARGKYLFDTVAACVECHSPRDTQKYLSPADPKHAGEGSEFYLGDSYPGKLYAPNLTPDAETGLGSWTDGEKIRAIREGISKDGHALFPIMPYPNFRNMSDEDVEAIVAYMNSMAPVRNPLPKSVLKMPLNLVVKWMPKPLEGPVPAVSTSDPVTYGRYLSKIGSCESCHTPGGEGSIDETRLFAGGREYGDGTMVVRTANLSPDMETGIGKWSDSRFVARFAEFNEYRREGATFPTATQANFTVMPWIPFAGMTESDLKAIHAYLRTVAPQVNKVEIHPPKP